MGSKARFAKELLPILLKDRREDQWYVEPFAGGCNMIDKVTGRRMANDSNEFLVAMWKALVERGERPIPITKEKYDLVRKLPEHFDPWYVGWVGFNCSFRGKWFGGFAGEAVGRDYQREGRNNILKQVSALEGVLFSCGTYDRLPVPAGSIIYCDPPYKGTTQYKDSNFNSEAFWRWVRIMSQLGNTVYVSEYEAPPDFTCVWEKKIKSALSSVESLERVERLWTQTNIRD